jgi:hypothetical protein
MKFKISESQIREAIKAVLTEHYHGVLYHYTTLQGLYGMICENRLKAEYSDGEDGRRDRRRRDNREAELDNVYNQSRVLDESGAEMPYICFTRDKSFNIRQSFGAFCRLTFDADALMKIRGAKLVPYNYFGNKFNSSNRYEAEERLYCSEGIYPLDKFVEGIEIVITSKADEGSLKMVERILSKSNESDGFSGKINVINKMTPKSTEPVEPQVVGPDSVEYDNTQQGFGNVAPSYSTPNYDKPDYGTPDYDKPQYKTVSESQLREAIRAAINEHNIFPHDADDDEYDEQDNIELTLDDYAYAFQQVYGRQPNDIEEIIEEYDLPIDGIGIIRHGYGRYTGTSYWAGPEYDENYYGWELSDEGYEILNGFTPQVKALIVAALRHHMEDDTEYNSSALDRVVKESFLNEFRIDEIISEAIQKIING